MSPADVLKLCDEVEKRHALADRLRARQPMQSMLREWDRLDARNAARGARGNGKVRG